MVSSFPLGAANYYWVNGTGHWEDYNSHWAQQSGSQIFHNRVPGPNDTVIFDSLSFTSPQDTVYAESPTMYCYNMIWQCSSDSIVFYSPADDAIRLRIYGSIILDTNLSWSYGGQIHFTGSDTNNIIKTAGHHFRLILFNGDTTGEWELQDSLYCAKLIFVSGTFRTNGNFIHTNIYQQDILNYSRQILDTSTIVCSKFRNLRNPVQFSASNSTFIITGDSLEGNGLQFGSVRIESTVLITGDNHINHLFVGANTELCGSDTILDLESEAGAVSLAIRSGNTVTIVDTIRFNGSCRGMSHIRCSSIRDTATIRFLSGPQYISNVFIENIRATGNTATASDCYVVNASGWNITSIPVPRTLYWVSGTGRWDDSLHWSLVPGGSGGECVPGPLDNVVFDQFSFSGSNDTVLLPIAVGHCHDINLSSANCAPLILQPEGYFQCNGSMLLATPAAQLPNTVNMRAMSGVNIISSPAASFNILNFDGNGTWNLNSGLSAGVLYFTNGNFNSGGNPINCNITIVRSQSVSVLDFSNSLYNVSSDLIHHSCAATFIAPQQLNCRSLWDFCAHNYNNVSSPGTFRLHSDSLTFTNLTVNGNAWISGNNSYDTLRFNGNDLLIQLHQSNTQYINGDLQIQSSCISPAMLESDVSGATAFLQKSNGTVNCDYLIMQDIRAYGGATFNATNTCAIFNVMGWNITPPPSSPMFWIGGNGAWNDPNHWSFTNGGPPGNCVPNPLTDVHFTSQSFTNSQQNVTINNRAAFCRNMTWSGITGMQNFSATSPGNFLYCYGGFTLTAGVTAQNANIILRSHSPGNILNPNNQNLGYLLFDGASGSWIITDTMTCDSINVVNGELRTNGSMITTLIFRSDTNCLRTIDLDTSHIVTGDWKISETQLLTLHAAASRITVHNDFFRGGGHMRYNKIDLLGNTSVIDSDTFSVLTITGNCKFRTGQKTEYLIFSGGGSITEINAGDTIIADSLISGGGISASLASIESSDPTIRAWLSCYNDTTCLEYVVLRGVNADTANSAVYFAGDYSSNTGNALNWQWSSCWPVLLNVWPGDVNNDLIVSNTDLLYLGIAFGQSGVMRSNASLNWMLQPSPPWNITFNNAADLAHSDCDGSGTADMNDTTAISINYGLTHPPRLLPPDSVLSTGFPLSIAAYQSIYQPGDTVMLPIWFGNQNYPVDSAYGIAFRLLWDQDFIEPGSLQFNYSNSWLAQSGNIIHLAKPFPNFQYADLAVSRINHADTSGYGELLYMKFVLTQNAFGPLKFWFNDITALNSMEDSIGVTGYGTTINAITGIESRGVTQISAFPNPVDQQLTVSGNQSGNGSVQITDCYGRTVYRTYVENCSRFTVSTADLSAGIYFLTMQCADSFAVLKFEKL